MVTTTRLTSSVPGLTGRSYYGDGEDEHWMIWRGPAARRNMPCLLYIKPGHLFNQGERVMDPHTSSSPALGDAVDLLYDSHGWPIVSVEFRPPYSADSPKRQPLSMRPWPGPILSLRKAMVRLREHWNDEALWGSGGSIDPNRIAVIGSSAGHTAGLLLACIPPSRMPSHRINGLHQGTLSNDHRPNAVCGFIGQTDWTQWATNPADTTGPFTHEIHQYFMGLECGRAWSTTELAIKKSASPWWWLPFLDPAQTAFWGAWGVQPTGGNGSNLSPSDFSPGTTQDSSSTESFFDPHHYFQAQPFEEALKRIGAKQRIIWGDSTDNPRGFNNENVGLDTATTAADLHKFLTRDLGWPAVS